MPRLLLDSHAFLWHLRGDARLSERAQAAIRDLANECFVSHASFWEIAIKVSIGKLDIGVGVEGLFGEALYYNFAVLAIEPADIAVVPTLAHHHRDPFDRILVAQAMTHGLTIVTKDQHIPLYGVHVLW